jgi:hypothetical protein
MKRRWLAAAGPAIVILLLGASPIQETKPPSLPSSLDADAPPQEYPVKKPKSDYMSSILGRNTKPLGLKEDLAVKRLLREPAIRWAVRAGLKHILN